MDQPYSAPNPHIPDSHRLSGASDLSFSSSSKATPIGPGSDAQRKTTALATTPTSTATAQIQHKSKDKFSVPTQLSSGSGSLMSEFRRWAGSSSSSYSSLGASTQNSRTGKGSINDSFVTPSAVVTQNNPTKSERSQGVASTTDLGHQGTSVRGVMKRTDFMFETVSTSSIKAMAGSEKAHAITNDSQLHRPSLSGPSLTSASYMQRFDSGSASLGSFASNSSGNGGGRTGLSAGSISDNISTTSTKATAGSARTRTSTSTSTSPEDDLIVPDMPFSRRKPAASKQHWVAEISPSSAQKLQRGEPVRASMLSSVLRTNFLAQV